MDFSVILPSLGEFSCSLPQSDLCASSRACDCCTSRRSPSRPAHFFASVLQLL